MFKYLFTFVLSAVLVVLNINVTHSLYEQFSLLLSMGMYNYRSKLVERQQIIRLNKSQTFNRI
jgi:hypothetical protein